MKFTFWERKKATRRRRLRRAHLATRDYLYNTVADRCVQFENRSRAELGLSRTLRLLPSTFGFRTKRMTAGFVWFCLFFAYNERLINIYTRYCSFRRPVGTLLDTFFDFASIVSSSAIENRPEIATTTIKLSSTHSFCTRTIFVFFKSSKYNRWHKRRDVYHIR